MEDRVVLVSEGFCSPRRTKAAWEERDRRDRYLLRADVEVPISADPRVTTRTEAPETDAWRIIVTAHTGDQPDPSTMGFGWQESYVDGARLLGFDVCDAASCSALTNCGYLDAHERDEARARWAPKLDAHHLFGQLDDARAFCRASDLRVVEHAPFLVMRILRGPS